MKEVKQILVITAGTCLGQTLFVLLTWLAISLLGLSLFSLFR